ncbi:7,8-dihydro-8-oxoguanine triphosphatase [Schistosoma japonicum]|uniref:7,8-dihydro-8-oxoguanine triphosphatase n=1 Tax=Schistosoma japonicum TaxID=6182 RepID=A0A4Z2CVF0_SCHJA|nr:7,8-dihydro-8-oxoguanine triphosphatase [Schistosoma japonicum]TNN08208.1 7,8-dihydro-8-oxoguanine triphosphatase [Schistosoma japonicum]
MPVSKDKLSPFTSHWVNRKLYTLMLVIYTPGELNKECPLVIDKSGSEIHVQESDINCDSKSWLLLGLKQRGFGKGRWNGFGGKVQSNDVNPKAGALRELYEESGLVIDQSSVDEVGRLWFTFPEASECMEVYVFTCRNWTPTHNGHTIQWPCYTEEMYPAWFPLGINEDGTVNLSTLPFDLMWPDDHLWFPHIFHGNLFLGWFHFTELSNQSTVSSQNLADCSKEANGVSFDRYEVPAYHLESFIDDKKKLYHIEEDNDCKQSSTLQQIIDQLELDKNDDNLRLWMNSLLYNKETVITPSNLMKTLHYLPLT